MRSGARRAALLGALLLFFWAEHSCWAAEPTPDEHYNRGVELAKAGRLLEARAEFEAAFTLHPHPRVAYNLAKIALELGERSRAIEHLRAYLAMDTSGEPQERVAQARQTLDQLQDQAPAPQPVPAPGAGAPTDPAPPQSDEATPRIALPPPGGDDPQPAPMPDDAAAGVSTPSATLQPRPVVLRPSPAPASVARPSLAPALTLAATGVVIALGGVGLWLWNDATYDELSEEHGRLQQSKPPPPTSAEELSQSFEYARDVGHNQAGFEGLERLDVIAWSALGIGTLCAAAGTYWLLSRPQTEAQHFSLHSHGFTARW